MSQQFVAQTIRDFVDAGWTRCPNDTVEMHNDHRLEILGTNAKQSIEINPMQGQINYSSQCISSDDAKSHLNAMVSLRYQYPLIYTQLIQLVPHLPFLELKSPTSALSTIVIASSAGYIQFKTTHHAVKYESPAFVPVNLIIMMK
jgi:hypothetical protein